MPEFENKPGIQQTGMSYDSKPRDVGYLGHDLQERHFARRYEPAASFEPLFHFNRSTDRKEPSLR